MKQVHVIYVVAALVMLQFSYAQKSKKEDKQALDSIKIDGLKWRNIGPALTSGCISDIAVNHTNPYAYTPGRGMKPKN